MIDHGEVMLEPVFLITIAEFCILTLSALIALIAAIYDYKFRRIPNGVTVPAIIAGFVLHSVLGGWGGFHSSLWGFVLGGGVFLVFYVLGGMGAGDVKLMGGIGALMGADKILAIIILTGLTGGVIAVGKMIRERSVGATIFRCKLIILGNSRAARIYSRNVHEYISKDTIPYGIAIAVGTLVTIAYVVFWGTGS
jgi:prepilin peptidase CpaA